ncbi:Fanconi anemia core complex-associated protein 100 isoform X3 [Tenrec ecaudatus]|uniref:Fanconi anemia core complex-associated protein 100 isoform X3 n=1 Tax=Tenrec ecaudatus TaxID=94439 RepID=UPI003F5A11E3
MAVPERWVDYLAALGCPTGGLAAGRPRVLTQGTEVLVAPGNELVYALDTRDLQPRVFGLPEPVRHLELLAPGRTLFVLCAGSGIYCVALDTPHRSASQAEDVGGQGDSDVKMGQHPSQCRNQAEEGHSEVDEDPCETQEGHVESGGSPSEVVSVGPDACILPDPSLCAFTLLGDLLVTVSQGPGTWKVRLFKHLCPGPGTEPGAQVGEVVVPAEPPRAPNFLPVLSCVSPPCSRDPHSCLPGPGGSTLQEALFGLLFGADAALVESPVVLCGFPDGQLCSVVLKTLVTSQTAPGDPKALVKVLHHLEEPIIFIGALRTEPQAQEGGDTPADCLVALGHHGRTLAITAGRDETETLVPEMQVYRLPGPVLCATCNRGSLVYYSTPSRLHVVNLAPGDSAHPGLPPLLCQNSLRVCKIVALSSPRDPEDSTKLLALSAGGRLMTCHVALDPARMTARQATSKIQNLLSNISSVSERVLSLKKAVEQQNQALTHLHEALDVSCALLSCQSSPKPIMCTTRPSWRAQGLHQELVATCRLENQGPCSLGPGWSWCIQVLPSSYDGATTYTVPIQQLAPGACCEVTLTLCSGEEEEGGIPDLPVTVSHMLFYSLQEVVGVLLAPVGTEEDTLGVVWPQDLLPPQDGACLPLGLHTVDLLQALRFPSLATPCLPPTNPIDTFLANYQEQGSRPGGQAALQAPYLPPSTVSIRVSSELLRAALGDMGTGGSLCCATLQWLLTEHSPVDVGKSGAPSSVQAVAPDGTSIRLTAQEVLVTDLGSESPIPAVEIQVESPSLATVCQAHHAMITRIQTVIMEQETQGASLPSLRVQCLRQIQANHEALLWEVRALQDRLSLESLADAQAIEQLLQLYQRLRNPSLTLL